MHNVYAVRLTSYYIDPAAFEMHDVIGASLASIVYISYLKYN